VYKRQIYPIVDLQRRKLNIQDFVGRLLSVTKKSLFEYGIYSESGEQGIGLFTEKGKIASVGLRVDQGVTRHGLSINISNDLSEFHRIRTCGVYERQMSSMRDFNVEVQCQSFFSTWMKHYLSISAEDSLFIPRTLKDFCFKGLESQKSH
jgi:lipoate-protein ligase B